MMSQIDLKDPKAVSRELVRLDLLIEAKQGTIRALGRSPKSGLIEHYRATIVQFENLLDRELENERLVPQRVAAVHADIQAAKNRKTKLQRYLPTKLLGRLAAVVKRAHLSRSEAMDMLQTMLEGFDDA